MYGQPTASLPVVEQFRMIVTAIRAVLSPRAAEFQAVFLLVHWRMGRAEKRFASLVAKILAGTLRPPRKRAPPDPEKEKKQRKQPWPPIVPLPGGKGWLLALVDGRHAHIVLAWASQLQTMVLLEALQTLIAADPKRMGRILRPICRMLGVELPEALRLPKRVRRKQADDPKTDGPESAIAAAATAALDASSAPAKPRRAAVKSAEPKPKPEPPRGTPAHARWAKSIAHLLPKRRG